MLPPNKTLARLLLRPPSTKHLELGGEEGVTGSLQMGPLKGSLGSLEFPRRSLENDRFLLVLFSPGGGSLIFSRICKISGPLEVRDSKVRPFSRTVQHLNLRDLLEYRFFVSLLLSVCTPENLVARAIRNAIRANHSQLKPLFL